ncbi:hypothetical protein G6F66_014397 [Rhizopus arrhizus]|nr:hypothetical protein G6F66_014397 [Rhizopus arrhizus]
MARPEEPISLLADALDGVFLGRGYRLALQLRLDDGGHVARMRLLDTTGSDRVDMAETRAITGMDVGAPPPAGMPQPVSVLLLPGGTHCAPPRRPAE